TIVGNEPACDPDMPLTECCATSSHCSRNPRKMCRHDIGVAFDHDKLAFSSDLTLGHVQAIQNLRLLIETCLWCIEILGAVIVVSKLSSTNTNCVACHISNRPHEPITKAIIQSPSSFGE